MKKTVLLLGIVLFFGLASSNSSAKNEGQSVRYEGLFQMSLDKHYFIYESPQYNRKIKLNSCNRNLAQKIFKRFYKKENPRVKRLIPNTKEVKQVSFERDGKAITAKVGSRIYAFLESLPKKISIYVALMRKPCP